MKEWEIWFAEFPYEEDANITSNRPVVILSVEPLQVLSVKVTTHEYRENDLYDVPLFHWQECGLNWQSIARVSKTIFLTRDHFQKKIGQLHTNDSDNIMKRYQEFINSLV